MKIGRFINNGHESIGAVYEDCWADLCTLMKYHGRKLDNNDLSFFLRMDKNELVDIEDKIVEAFKKEDMRSTLFHPLEESIYLPPIPDIPRLFTQRGNGSIFARTVTLKKPCQPVFELRYPHNLEGHNCTAVFPSNYSNGAWNIELVAVFGMPGENIKEEDAYNHIAGYTIMIDHSGSLKNSPFQNEWFIEAEEKEMVDHFYSGCFNGNGVMPTPIGPWITTPDEIPDPHNLWVIERERDNFIGKIHTSSLTYSFAEAVSFMSRFVALKTGDMISSASIGYDGYRHWNHYEEGSYVEVEVEKIGKLRMNIRDERGNIE
jgi:2-keto-4-pentenoate hydratase/2-oxohepta-3-ene-1,7-dioic acid hydratase in catechol pathway